MQLLRPWSAIRATSRPAAQRDAVPRSWAFLALLLAVVLAPAAPIAAAEREHPYLFFTQAELPGIRAKISHPTLSAYRTVIERDAREAVAAPVDKHHDRRTNTMNALLWGYVFTGDVQYRERWLAWAARVWDATDFPEWSEMTVSNMAIGYDILHQELAPASRASLRAYLERALATHLKKSGSWHYINPSNTVPVAAGGLGMAALALHGESKDAARGIQIMQSRLQTFADRCFPTDGGYIEGMFYGDFGGSYYLIAALALRNTTGDDSLLEHPGYLAQQRSVESLLGGTGTLLAFNDSQPLLTGMPICTDLGTRKRSPLMLWMADAMARNKSGDRSVGRDVVTKRPNGSLPADIRPSFFWVAALLREARMQTPEFPGVPTISILQQMQWGVMRSDPDYVPRMVVGLKGSAGTLSHHKQHDLGSFTLDAQGEMLLIDPGYYHKEPESHTLPMIDGKGPSYSGSTIGRVFEHGSIRSATLDSTRAYGGVRVRRVLVMHGAGALIVLDDIGPGTVQTRFQCAQAVEVDGSRAHVHGLETDLAIRFFGRDLKLGTTGPHDFGKAWIYRGMGKDVVAWHTLHGEYQSDGRSPLITVLMPVPKNSSAPMVDVESERGGILIRSPHFQTRFIQGPDGWQVDPASVAGAGDRPRQGDQRSRDEGERPERTPARATAPTRFRVPPNDLLVEYDQRLRQQITALCAQRKGPEVPIGALNSRVQILDLNDDGMLSLRIGQGAEATIRWVDLSPLDRAGIAVAAIRPRTPEDHATAACLLAAAGEHARVAAQLQLAGEAGSGLRDSLGTKDREADAP